MNYFFDPILKQYFDFKGVATRKQFWLFIFFSILFGFMFTILDAALGWYDVDAGVGILSSLFNLFIFIPSLAIMARRLHDAGFSAWWLLLIIIPFGFLILLIFMLLPSKLEGNKYRPSLDMAMASGGVVAPERAPAVEAKENEFNPKN